MDKSIERIYISCHKGDFWQTKICVASIRYWYPQIPIFLIKDLSSGQFDTSFLEYKFNVDIAKFPIDKFGWGVSKLEPYFIEEKVRCLILDSDIVFLGKVIDYLNIYEETIVVSSDGIKDETSAWFKRTYYDLHQINSKIDPDFKYPGFTFNTGQLVVDTNLLSRSDFDFAIEWSTPPKVKQPEIFACADQGILNYYLPYLEQQGNLKIAKSSFKIWGNSPEVNTIDLKIIQRKEGYPKLIHWAGGFRFMEQLNRRDVIEFYQKEYYSRFSFGELRRKIENFKLTIKFKYILSIYKRLK
ncbi:glycosyltransferase [Robertkochia solimangrovi]|uniref:glycosyltransferase n=1 Tax=Robertkochia solimangrovi TaxID=2213046 RepID=UPI0013A55E71|nr:glycosyltransferase [Robertkochia solimangrovi]